MSHRLSSCDILFYFQPAHICLQVSCGNPRLYNEMFHNLEMSVRGLFVVRCGGNAVTQLISRCVSVALLTDGACFHLFGMLHSSSLFA